MISFSCALVPSWLFVGLSQHAQFLVGDAERPEMQCGQKTKFFHDRGGSVVELDPAGTHRVFVHAESPGPPRFDAADIYFEFRQIQGIAHGLRQASYDGAGSHCGSVVRGAGSV